MGSTKVACDKAKEILNHWGYREFTELQKLVFRNCGCEEAAREFVIGSTSSGKTLIPLICYEADKREARRRNKLLYIIPYRALATQKEKEIRQKFPKENVVVSTSEYCSDDINVLNANCDIAIVIYEKVFMFISNNKGFFEQYSHIVFDELGVIESAER